LSHEDVEDMQPLNTPAGQQFIDSVIRDLGGLDLIIFDNIMALIAGDQKDEEGWRQTMPWVRVLTQRNIGQIWVHHTGHDESRSYGTKTREWQMDTVLHLEQVSRMETDVSFQLNFRKARERTPATRADFADVRIALVNDQWEGDQASASRKGEVRPLSCKFFEALRDATIGNEANKMFGYPAASFVDWQAECVKRGLLERGKPDSVRSMFSKHKLDLISANWIACNDTMAWVLP
jgi:hypothetical protein